ncbi:MAG TPA: hypothetical protein VHA11_14265 [Bryobacteraceae bacterium]|nr:hypothetical protein [Bryobacteraceae bacterium]
MSEDWDFNYFNYFTEIEEHFQRARGTGLFLLSPLDWSLVEIWKNSGIPLEAVLRGIDEAFEKWRSRKSKVRMINSLAYCAQAVLEQAQIMAGTAEKPSHEPAPPPFPVEDLRAYLQANASALRARPGAVFEDAAAVLDRLAAEADQHFADLEDLERRLTVLEEKIIDAARAGQSDDDRLEARRAFDLQIRPYRGKMTAEQIVLLEKQFMERRLLELTGLPRLSLFYLR